MILFRGNPLTWLILGVPCYSLRFGFQPIGTAGAGPVGPVYFGQRGRIMRVLSQGPQ